MMKADEIYEVLLAADVLGLIRVNSEEVLESVLTNSEFLQGFDHKADGDPVYRAVALLVELDRENPVFRRAALAKQFPDYTVHRVTALERYVSSSGNDTWKAFDEDGEIIYLRQKDKNLLVEAGYWATLNLMPAGATWDCEIVIHTTKDGDFRKPVQIDEMGRIDVPVKDVPHPLECQCPECVRIDLKPDTAEDDMPYPPENETNVIEWADRLLSGGDVVVVDFETSDLDGYPIEAAVIAQDGTELFNRRIKPPEGLKIAAEAQQVHGISLDDLKDCSEWSAVASDFADAIKGKTVVIYNADFDTRLIQRANSKYGIPFQVKAECAMLQYAEYNGNWNSRHGNYRWVKLAQAAHALGVEVANEHSAAGDARMTLEVIKALAAKAKTDKPMTKQAPF